MFDHILKKFEAKCAANSAAAMRDHDELMAAGTAFLASNKTQKLAEATLREIKYVACAAEVIVEFVNCLEQNTSLYQAVDELFTSRLTPLANLKATAQGMMKR